MLQFVDYRLAVISQSQSGQRLILMQPRFPNKLRLPLSARLFPLTFGPFGVGNTQIGTDWTSVPDSANYTYVYPISDWNGSASPTEDCLNKMGPKFGGLTGGEFFNYSVRSQCVDKIRI